MAHLYAPKHPDPKLPVFYNVDGVVGVSPAVNNKEDVLLVQFAFKIIADAPGPTTPPEVILAAKAVSPTGHVDSATITAIGTFQQGLKTKLNNPQIIVDRRVSPVVLSDYSYAVNTNWTIVQLNLAIRIRHRELWPRIDKIPGCPGEIKQMVMRQVVGTT